MKTHNILLFFAITISIFSYSHETLCNELPQPLTKIEDFEIIFKKLEKLDAANLPKYNDEFFRNLFNRNYVDSIYQCNEKNQSKREMLVKAAMMYSKFSDLYLIRNTKLCNYRNESARICVLSTYSMILAYELIDNELKEQQMSFPDEKTMLLVKDLKKEFWGMNFQANSPKILDRETKGFIKTKITELKFRVNKISFLNYKENTYIINYLYLPNRDRTP